MIRKTPDKGLIDLTGKRFGCLEVLRRANIMHGRWVCKCDCGRLIVRTRTAVLRKKYKMNCTCGHDNRRGRVNLEFEKD